MKNLKLEGCGTALVTPFRKDGSVDFETYGRLVQRQYDAGIHFFVPLGTTAETPCLENDEKIRLLEMTVERAGGRPVVAGAGSNSTAATVRNIAMLSGYGADAFLVVTPYYNKPTQRGLYEHFKAVAESTDRAIVLYNVPGRTGVNMTAETVLRLAEIPNIIAVKEASGNYAQISSIIRDMPENFTVLSGNDDETLSLMSTGASGVISVASNIAPAQMTSLAEALLSNDMDRARELHYKLMPLFRNCFVESNPIPVKAGMAAMGLIENELRSPLFPATEATFSLMANTVKEL